MSAFQGYNVETHSPGAMGYYGDAGSPMRRFSAEPYTADDYRMQLHQFYRPGGGGYEGRGNGGPAATMQAFANSGFSMNDPNVAAYMKQQGYDPKTYLPQQPAPASQQPSPSPAGQMGQYNTGIPQYNPAPFGTAMGLINPGWMGVSQPGQQQAGQQAGDLLRQMQFGGALDLTQQANMQNTQQQLAHQQAGANAGLQMGGLNLGAYQNLLSAMAPFDQFAANMGTLPIRATGSLLTSLLGM